MLDVSYLLTLGAYLEGGQVHLFYKSLMYKSINVKSTFPNQQNKHKYFWPGPYSLHLLNEYALSINYVLAPVLEI